jgi:MEMO1 family protein
MLIFGLISPHPPIILPDIGGSDLPKVKLTIEALELAVKQLAAAKPEKLIIISPHEGHGFAVPLHYVSQALPAGLPIEEILVTNDSYQYYFDYGKQVGEQKQRESARYAIVASGDLSHVLKADGPYGYNAAGPVLDKLIVTAVEHGDAQALLTLDPTLLDAGAECGLRSILFLLGALDGQTTRPNVLSYEGPFGVGYLVATAKPVVAKKTTPETLPALARRAIIHYLQTGRLLTPPPELVSAWPGRAGAFVSVHKKDGTLRGCIGTIMPIKPNVIEEVIANAVASATDDPRFEPIAPTELEDLKLSVDVLTPPKPVQNLSHLNPKVDGIIVSTTDKRQGVLLPELESVDSVEQQIEICRQKGGIGPQEPIIITSFRVQRYHEAPV